MTPDKTSEEILAPAISFLGSPHLAAGVPYAYAAAVGPPSRLIVTAGACPIDADGNTVAVGDVSGQTEQVMRNLRLALQAAGADLADIVKLTVYVATSGQDDLYVASLEVHRQLGDHQPPSTLIGVTVLGYPDQLVEVEAIAAVDPRTSSSR